MRNKQDGFTLLEMLIVVGIIAVIVGVALPNFRGTQDEANNSAAKAELRTIATGLESYATHNDNSFPTKLSDLTKATPKIVSEVPADPFQSGGKEYSYKLSKNKAYYVSWSVGMDRASDITGIGDTGILTGKDDDDIFVTNGTGTFK